MPAEYEAIKRSLRKRYPKASEEDIATRASRIFGSIYGTNPEHAKKLENEGKWASYKKSHGHKETSIDESIFVYTPGLELKETDSEGNVYVETLVSTPDLDLGNDIISESAQVQIVDQLLSPLGNKVSLFHKRNGEAPIGIVKEAKLVDTPSGKGAWAKILLNRYHPQFESTVRMIEQKFIDGSSIEYVALDTVKKQVGNVVARVVDGIKVLGLGLTGRPMNPNAQIQNMFVKSLDVVQEEKLKGDEIMSKKETNDPVDAGQIEVKEDKSATLVKENDALKQKIAEFEAKEAEFKKALEVKEKEAREVVELKEKISKLEVKEKVLAEQTTKIQDESSKVELEFKEFRAKPSWEGAAKLINKYKI